MSNADPGWNETLIRLLALAARMEGEGQYNIAKLARAAADAMARRAAYERRLGGDKSALACEIEQVASALPGLGVEAGVSAALRRGAAALVEGRVPLIDETPHPYVCRTCGHLVLGEPAERCPACGAWPGTFQRFMPVYWFDALEPLAAVETLRQTPVKVSALLEGLPEAGLSQPADDGGWAIRNTVTHLRDAQDVLAYRLDLFMNEEHPVLASKAVWSWATDEPEHPPTTRDIFESYRASRAETVAKLEGLPMIDWWRTGQHEEFGTITLRQQVSYFAAHEITHLPQIAALRPGR